MFGPIHPALFCGLFAVRQGDLSGKWRLLRGFAYFVVDMSGLGHSSSVISNYCLVCANYTNFLAQTPHIPVHDGNLLQPSAKDPTACGDVSPP